MEVVRGPNIKPFPLNTKLTDSLEGRIIIKTEDNITTDHIMPSNAKLLPYRSNIPHLANFCFSTIDEDFAKRAKENKGGFIVGGDNYGQGSSREHAALAPLYLGIKGVIAKSFARIHKANLINSGIIPMEFENLDDYDKIDQMDVLTIDNIYQGLKDGRLEVKDEEKNISFFVKANFNNKEIDMLMAGGKLNSIKMRNSKEA